jgi:hypothetical protein
MPIWDVLCNIETRKISVNKDIRSAAPPPSLFPTPPPILPRSGTVKSEGSGYEDDAGIGRIPSQKEGKEMGSGKDFIAKSDNPDNLFMEDVRHRTQCHGLEQISNIVVCRFWQRSLIIWGSRLCVHGSPNMSRGSCGWQRVTRRSTLVRQASDTLAHPLNFPIIMNMGDAWVVGCRL